MSITLSQLRQQARERADMTNSTFVTDTELNSYVNKSLAELYDILVQCYGSDYYTADPVYFYAQTGVENYDIPTILAGGYGGSGISTGHTFYKLAGLDAKVTSQEWSTLKPYMFNERNRFQRFGIWDRLGITNLRYRLIGNNIKFAPVPTSQCPLRIWYVPAAPILVADADVYDDLNQFAEYIIVDAAIKMLQKEESDVSVLLAEKAALKRRIEEAGQNRDAGKPESIGDIYIEDDFFWY